MSVGTEWGTIKRLKLRCGGNNTDRGSISTRRGFLILAVVLMAANLRPTITGVGPLISDIVQGTGISGTLAGLVTTIPLMAFGLISPLAPRWARRFGLERTLITGLGILLAGTLLRSWGGPWTLLSGMFLVGAGAAIGNVLLPSLIKRDFSRHIGIMTGIYTTTMNVFAGIASGISVPLARQMHLGWRGSLESWAVLSLVALVVWLPLARHHHTPDEERPSLLMHSLIAWQITLFMGLQSFLFYVNVAWLPTLLHDRGMSLTMAGWLVSLMQIVSLPATFIVPILAGRQARQQHLVLWISALFLIGYAGLLTTRGTIVSVIWVIFVGFGAGASISLALLFFSLRARTHQLAGNISGMAQSIGYVLAACGPISVGLFHSWTGSWALPLSVMLLVVVLMAVFGLGAGRDVFVEEELALNSSANRS